MSRIVLKCALAVERKYPGNLAPRLLSSTILFFLPPRRVCLAHIVLSSCFEAGIVQDGVGVGVGVHAEPLQVAFSTNEPGLSEDPDGNVPRFGLPFNINTPADHREERMVHPYTREVSGMFLGPGEPYKSNHGKKYIKKFAGLLTWKQLHVVNLNYHEQHLARQRHYLPSLNNMKLDIYFVCFLRNPSKRAVKREDQPAYHRQGGQHGIVPR